MRKCFYGLAIRFDRFKKFFARW